MATIEVLNLVQTKSTSTSKRFSASIIEMIVAESRNSMLPILTALILIAVSVSGKVYERCELATALAGAGIPKGEIPMWVCIANFESNLNSDAIGKGNGDGSWDHGLWQISDKWWVGRDKPGGECGLSADQVRGDNFENAVKCVIKIYEEHQRLQGDGWMAWAVYSNQGHCKDDLSPFIVGCGL